MTLSSLRRSRRVLLSIALASLFLAVGAARPASGQAELEPASEREAVEAGKKALTSATNFPWYDSSKDDLRRINVKPPKPPPPPRDSSSWFNWDFSWLSTVFESFGVLVKILIYVILFALLALLVYLLVKAFLARESNDADDDEAGDEDEDGAGKADRVEELPVQLTAPRGDFLAEARRRYEAGDYSGAVIYLFSYQLLQLDRHQRIQLTRGKTNRQYLREVRGEPRLEQMLARTMVAFEDVFFGHHPLERERFESCWREIDEFHQRTPQGGVT